MWIKSDEGSALKSPLYTDDWQSCMEACIEYPKAKYFEWAYPNHTYTGEPNSPNAGRRDLRKACFCKLSNDGGGRGARSTSGDLSCGGFYIGRLLKNHRKCEDPGHHKHPCHFEWWGTDRQKLKVNDNVVARGIKYEFSYESHQDNHKCTFMDGNKGIM